MRRLSCLLVLAAAGVMAQDTGAKPAQGDVPSDVDQALRERATKFLQAHVDGKYRVADQYVAEDSKDIYFAAQKPRYLSFQIQKIAYSDNFTKATVTAKVELEVTSPMGRMTLNVPQESFWKIENGQWFWWVDPNIVRTPFGTAQRSQQPSANEAGQAPHPVVPPSKITVEDLWKQVTISKSEIRFSKQPASETVVLRNAMPGVVTVQLQVPEIPGLEVKVDRDRVPPKGTARILVNYKPQAQVPLSVVLNVVVNPTNQVLPIKLVFDQAAVAKQ